MIIPAPSPPRPPLHSPSAPGSASNHLPHLPPSSHLTGLRPPGLPSPTSPPSDPRPSLGTPPSWYPSPALINSSHISSSSTPHPWTQLLGGPTGWLQPLLPQPFTDMERCGFSAKVGEVRSHLLLALSALSLTKTGCLAGWGGGGGDREAGASRGGASRLR